MTVVAAASSGIRVGAAAAWSWSGWRSCCCGGAARVLAEGACPACLALGLLGPAARPAPATDILQA